jgi:type II secretory ATPase GspE/PulE/Tfp pilus assembly ATPase PilB-like protein
LIIECGDECLAFSTNPLSSLEAFKIRNSPMNAKLNNSIGFIDPSDTLLNVQKKSSNAIDAKTIIKDLFTEAVNLGVSDIHIQPRNSSHVCFKFRLDGMMVNSKVGDVSNLVFQSIAAGINTLFNIDIGAYNAIQESQADTKKIEVLNDKQKPVNLRLELNPLHVKFKDGTQKGKHIPNYVIRLIGSASFRSLAQIGLTDLQVKEITGFCKHNNAGIFIAGPTGSGKTTLAYAILAEIHNQRRGISVMSVEDPVEVDLPNTQQIQIKEKLGFAQALKAILRSDPDVVFCGEIRDKETAHHVCATREVGNTILTTIHADKSFDVIDRLKSTSNESSFAVALDTIAKTVSIIIMPRLVRKVCKYCATEIKVEDDVLFGKYTNYFDIRATLIKKESDTGCEQCSHTGYKGRTQVAEVFVIDSALQQMIINNESSDKIHIKALKNQSKDIYSSAVMLVKEGITTLSEITRILPSRVYFGAEYESHHEVGNI